MQLENNLEQIGRHATGDSAKDGYTGLSTHILVNKRQTVLSKIASREGWKAATAFTSFLCVHLIGKKAS